jgi:hypothetical protein
MTDLGRLKRIDPRSVWAHEAHGFTPWLLANADHLAEVLGIEIELHRNEEPVGGYSLDLIGRDLTNDAVLMVENQLAATDHSHLGQVLTYAAGTAASTVVWVATRFREEHRQALDWLNVNTGQNIHFFGIELEVVQIGDSTPAPLLSVVVQPNEWQKEVRARAQSTSVTGKAALYTDFWTSALARIRDAHPDWTTATKGPAQNWMWLRPPLAGVAHSIAFGQGGRLRTELYIDSGDGDRNDKIFDHLLAHRDPFEAAFGRPVEWDRIEGRRASRVADYTPGDVSEVSRHEEFIAWIIDSGERLRRAVATVPAPPE